MERTIGLALALIVCTESEKNDAKRYPENNTCTGCWRREQAFLVCIRFLPPATDLSSAVVT